MKRKQEVEAKGLKLVGVESNDLERTLCDIVRGSGSDVQIVGEAMKRYAGARDKNIGKLMEYAERLRVKPKVLRYMEVLL